MFGGGGRKGLEGGGEVGGSLQVIGKFSDMESFLLANIYIYRGM